jgi:hypothetical protein
MKLPKLIGASRSLAHWVGEAISALTPTVSSLAEDANPLVRFSAVFSVTPLLEEQCEQSSFATSNVS